MANTASTWSLDLPPLKTEAVGSWVCFYDAAESTQELARAHRVDGAVFVADTQRAGRGCHGRAWHRAPGLGLWLSVALEGPPAGLTWAGALAVRDAAWPRARLNVKWPNDLLLNGRKVAGVLAEHRDGWNALGIGVNVHHGETDFPEPLRGEAGSLQQLTGDAWDRGRLLADILRELDLSVTALRGGGLDALHARWVRTLGIMGRRVRHGGTEGRITSIDRDGALLLETDGGPQRIIKGPVEYLDGLEPCSS